jgi:hypothetical protein
MVRKEDLLGVSGVTDLDPDLDFVTHNGLLRLVEKEDRLN